MGFLIRTGFWSSLVLLAVPLGTGVPGMQPVGPIETFMAAREAIGDITGICERKPDVCRIGKSAMQTVGVRAREAARIAYEVLDEKLDDGHAGTDATATGGIDAPPAAPTEITVTPMPRPSLPND
jgi:hypothetical protein